KLFPQSARFPTLPAEDLAARFLETKSSAAPEAGLLMTSLPGVWQFASAGRRVLALHRAENLTGRMRAAVASEALPADIGIEWFAPGQETDSALMSIAAGVNLP